MGLKSLVDETSAFTRIKRDRYPTDPPVDVMSFGSEALVDELRSFKSAKRDRYPTDLPNPKMFFRMTIRAKKNAFFGLFA